LDRGERPGLVEEVGPECPVEPLHPGEARCVTRWLIAFLRQILSNSTSPPFPNRSVNCLPLSVRTSPGTPNRTRASAKARHTARLVACSTTFELTQNRE